MLSFELNWLAIIVAAVANMIVGAVWYAIWAEPWMQGLGKTREDIEAESSPSPYIVATLNALLMAFVLANVIRWAGVTTLWGGLFIGVIMWVGFNGLAMATNHAFEERSLTMWAINSGHYLAALVVMGAILGVWW